MPETVRAQLTPSAAHTVKIRNGAKKVTYANASKFLLMTF